QQYSLAGIGPTGGGMQVIDTLAKSLRILYRQHLSADIDSRPTESSVAIWKQEISGSAAELLDRDLGIWFKFRVVDSPNDVSRIVGLGIQEAIADASHLLMKNTLPESASDHYGTWSIALVFLAPQHCRRAWESAIQELRAQSGFTEELSV